MSYQNSEMYIGTRGEKFKSLIESVVSKGNVSPKFMKALTSEESMKEYSRAFTSTSANQENNYEIYEQLGDGYFHSFIVWYSYSRFPQLNCTKGVKVVARIKINYSSKQTFHIIAKKLGFWPFISASVEERAINEQSLLEDVFESFLGVTGFLIEKNSVPGVGYAVIYSILKNIFDDIQISLSYEDLYDAKTRLKETFDKFEQELGGRESYEINYNETERLNVTTIYIKNKKIPKYQWKVLAQGKATGQKESGQIAAKNALEILKSNGIFKEPPEEYKFFCAV